MSLCLAALMLKCLSPGWASIPAADRLVEIRRNSTAVEERLVHSLRDERQARENVVRIKRMQALHLEERRLAVTRMKELENALAQLEIRRVVLNERIALHQQAARNLLIQLSSSDHRVESGLDTEGAAMEMARRRVLEGLASRSIREIETFRVDLADADRLEGLIQKERQQLPYLTQDLLERESVMELSRQLQVELMRKRKGERAEQLESYRELKRAESKVEGLIEGFNSRLELEKSLEAEKALRKSAFATLKGALPWPIPGAVVGEFGRALDPRSQLYVFKKGIDIAAGASKTVLAVAAGKVAFSGEMAGYGRIVILDHGEKYYTISGNLGEVRRKAGEFVAQGDSVGISDSQGKPVYFEIRSRNIAVNPLQWVSR